MAANKQQGQNLTGFLVALTATCAGIAYFSTGYGKLFTVIGVVALIANLAGLWKAKPLEVKPALRAAPVGLKMAGALAALLGWVLILFGLHFITGTGGRIMLALIGIAVSLFGIVYLLPAAFNK